MKPLPRVDEFDIVKLRFDHPLPVTAAKELEPYCRDKPKILPASVENHPRWTHTCLLLGPTSGCWAVLKRLLGTSISMECCYVEMARDLIVRRAELAQELELCFWRSAVLVGSRGSTATYPRDDERWCTRLHKRDVPVNLATYTDLPRKSNSPYEGRLRFHAEIRLTGAEVIRGAGLTTCEDFAAFDFDAFWARRLKLYEFPRKKVELGREISGRAARDLSATALTNRANKVLRDDALAVNGKLSMHQILKEHANLKNRLRPLTFDEWQKVGLKLGIDSAL